MAAVIEIPLAKLSRPRVGKVVPRKRLFSSLDALRQKPVVWIAAHPGAGKTTLLASFLEARKVSSLWYQVDSGDADPASFFYHLGLAARSLGRAKAAAPMPLLTPEFLGDVAAFSRRFFRELYQRMGVKSALVLDNLHEAPEDSPLHRVLAAAFEEVPEGIVVFVASRVAPAAAYAPLVARGSLARVDAAEMRLSLEETGEVVAASDLDPEAVRALHERSGGWAAGVRLLMERSGGTEALAGRDSVEALEEIFGHFAEQSIANAFQGDLDTLLQLSVVPRFTPAIARELTGDAGAEALLERLHRRNLFTERRRSGSETTYQFHNLMRAYLQRKVRQSWTEARRREVSAHAAAVLEGHGHSEEALALRRELGDWEAVARITLAQARSLLVQQRRRTLLEWIDAIPQELHEAYPWLPCWRGWALAHEQPRAARAAFQQAHATFARNGDGPGRIVAATGIVLTHSFELAKVIEADPWIEELVAAVEGGVRFPEPAIELRVLSAVIFGWSFRGCRLGRDEPVTRRLMGLLDQDVAVSEKVGAAGLLLGHCYHRARFDDAERLVAVVNPWVQSPQLTPGDRALWQLQVGYFQLFRGRAPESIRSIEASLQTCREAGLSIPVVDCFAHFGLAICAICEGEFDRADACLARAQQHWKVFRYMDVAASAMIRSVLANHRGDRDAAAEYAREHLEAATQMGVIWGAYSALVHGAFTAAESGDPAKCAELLTQARAYIDGTCHAPFAYQADLVEAYDALVRGDEPRLRAMLAAGLAAGRFDQGKLILRLQPRLLPRLYAAALARGIEVDSVRRAIREHHTAPPDPTTPGWPWPLEVRTLGRFEVRRDGSPLEFSRKAPRKTLQLLKAIIAAGGTHVPEQTLLAAFWPDEEGDAASKSLGAAVLRLRALLGDADAVIQQAGTLSLDRSRVWVDVWAFEHSGDTDIYGGAFLPEEEDVPWPVPMRERLRARFIHGVGERGDTLEAQGRHEDAIELYLRGLDADSIVEPFYQGLMRCYAHLDRVAEAVSTYRRLKQILSVTLGLPPSATTERLRKSLRLG
jgi:ATP/maltotriose-dependent transcriptional regulator MalT/DNA-binding SARP family transcriptional activator